MKITQASALGLLGITSAAYAPSHRVPSNGITASTIAAYPLYRTLTVPTALNSGLRVGGNTGATDQLTAINPIIGSAVSANTILQTAQDATGVNILKKGFTKEEPYACFREQQFYFPSQYITAGGINNTVRVDDTIGENTLTFGRTFWQNKRQIGNNVNDIVHMGKMFSNEDFIIPMYSAAPIDFTTGVHNTDATTRAAAFLNWKLLKTEDKITNASSNTIAIGLTDKVANQWGWACCNSILNQQSCNGGMDIDMVTGKSNLGLYRLIIKEGLTAATLLNKNEIFPGQTAADKPMTDSYNNSQQMLQYNNDILLASMAQDSFQTAWGGTRTRGTTNMCDYPIHTFTASATADISVVTAESFTGYAKCTYQFVSDNAAAPAFKIVTDNWRNYLLHYMEWLKDADLSTNAFLASSSTAALEASQFKLGNYKPDAGTSGSNGPMNIKWLNPIKSFTASWPATLVPSLIDYGTKMNYFEDASKMLPGSPGNVVWQAFDHADGMLEKETYTTMDGGILTAMLKMAKDSKTAFDASAATYETAKTAYNTALKDEKARDAAATPDPIVIPTRPCPPTAPSAYTGLSLPSTFMKTAEQVEMVVEVPQDGTNLWQTAVTNALFDTKIKNRVQPYSKLQGGATETYKVIGTLGNKYGWLQASDQIAPATAATEVASHVFGRLGQGEASSPDNALPWKWDHDAAVTTNLPVLMVSIFPEVKAQTAMKTGESITMTASRKLWASYSDYSAPAASSAPAAPDAVSAVYLAATSAAAAALALATLY